jgi:hypothetical protein
MNLHRQIVEKALLAILFVVSALNANAYKLYLVYRMIF